MYDSLCNGRHAKIVSFDEISSIVKKYREAGKKIVHCHGTFDLIHPGHAIHFEESKQFGDKLIVTVTGERFVNKGPRRPYFNDELRVRSLTALESIDHVVIVPYLPPSRPLRLSNPMYTAKEKNMRIPITMLLGT